MNNKGAKRIIKKILHNIASFLSTASMVILIAIGGFLLYYFLSSKIYEKKGEQFKPIISLYTIISPSMEPNIKVYDVVVNTKVKEASDVKVGDVITFISSSPISEGLTVTHRVTGYMLNNEGVAFTTQGDNNPTQDEGIVYFDQILGKVAFKIPQLGRVQFLIASKGGWFIIVLIPALGVIIYDVIKLCKLLMLKENMKKEKNNTGEPSEEEKRIKKEQEEERKRLLYAKYGKSIDNQ